MGEIVGAAQHIPCSSGVLPEQSWAERIPAAIQKAEGLVTADDRGMVRALGYVKISLNMGCVLELDLDAVLSKEEVALAKALRENTEAHLREVGSPTREWWTGQDGSGFGALRAFCEKVEALHVDNPPEPAVG